MKKRIYIWFIAVVTILFCLAVGFDVSEYIRGPSYYAPEWRWTYLFENTLLQIHAPLLFILFILILYDIIESRQKFNKKGLFLFLTCSIILFFSFQFAVLYFSRSGVGVLIHRIINPEINGYFTAALTIQSVPEFLRHYNTLMLDFVYHAKAHPPGAILLFYYINQVMLFSPALGDWASQQIPKRDDVLLVWETLQASEKATVFASAIIIPLLSALSVIPLYFTTKLFYGIKAATRSVFLFTVIPNLFFFIPINDAFLHLFSLSAFCFFAYGLQKNNSFFLFIAGVITFLGILFNLSLLPILVLLFIYFVLHEFTKIKKHFYTVLRKGLTFASGLLVPLLSLFVFFGFNFIEVTMTIMKHVPDVHTRSYVIWIFYNLYDFFVFVGIPVTIVYFSAAKDAVLQIAKKSFGRLDLLLIAFTCMILIVNFSGSVRGETGRLWIPYVPFLVMLVSGFLTNSLKFSTKMFCVILLLQMLQILVMQEFWVMLW